MRALFDVNMLLALFDSEHVQHQAATDWRNARRDEGWASCPITQNGFLRIMSRSSRPQPVRLASALAALQAQTAAGEHEFWPDQISIVDPTVFNHDRILGPSQITDVYLLALAVKNQGQLVTFDRSISFAAIRGAEPRQLVVL